MKASEYRSFIRKNKYHAKKTYVGDILFDSKKEARRYSTLCEWERFGVITNLQRQVVFELQPGYTSNQGKKVQPIRYIADFTYERDSKRIVEDTKSAATRTREYLIKRKIFEYKYPEYTFVES